LWKKFEKDIDSDDSEAKKQDDLQKENEIKAIFDADGVQPTKEKLMNLRKCGMMPHQQKYQKVQ
jgi:hypothetical protein